MAAPKRRGRRPAIDFEAVTCIDIGHHWDEVYFGYADSGFLQGMPIRIAVCSTCHSQRLDHLTWDGRVTSRQYAPDEAYITNARALGDFVDRRRTIREAKAKHLRETGAWGERLDMSREGGDG